MSQDKCPRCGGNSVDIARNFKATRICRTCGNRWEPIDWQARAAKAEEDAAAQRDRAEDWRRAHQSMEAALQEQADWKARAEKAEAELQSLKRLIRENLDYAADGRDWKGEVTKYVIYPETANEIYEATK